MAKEQGVGDLSRGRIVSEAVRIADAAGLDGLSMRKVAARLGAAPMALYRHVVNKDDLLDGMVEVVYAEVDVRSGVGWQAAMRQRAVDMRMALQRHPWAIGVMEPRTPGPANLRYHNATLASLREEAGLPLREAVTANSLMDSYIYGSALQEKTLGGDIPAEAEARRDTLTTTDPSLAQRFPYLIEVVAELGASGYAHDEQFEMGIDIILDGIEKLRK